MTDTSCFAGLIEQWQIRHGRHELPWQQPRSPYRVWVSEVMLQQTRVETVLGYFQRFMERFPDPAALARANIDEVLALWSGLGYYSRARNLHRAAVLIRDLHGGAIPDTTDELIALPGIGRSTAGAILSLGFDQRAAILDGNVKRVLARYHGLQEDLTLASNMRQLWQWAEEITMHVQCASTYTQGIMDLGSSTCLPRQPNCPTCPLQPGCTAHAQKTTALIPARKQRRSALPLRSTRMFIAIDDQNRILLEKRPGSGIWGGLWSLPESAPFRFTTEKPLPEFRHSFTHFQLDIQPVQITPGGENQVAEAGNMHWFGLEQAMDLGIPAPVRIILQQLSETMETS